MQMNSVTTAGSYRFAFNGMEKDKEASRRVEIELIG